MKQELIFVTGFFGASIEEEARKLAKEKGYTLISLDDEIEKSDGRSIRRICMLMGEHEYRNKEYEALSRIVKNYENNTDENSSDETGNSGTVVFCGDGVLHDGMSRDIIEKHTLIVIGTQLSCDDLWKNAKNMKNTYHAFMDLETEEKRRAAFNDFYERQQKLYMVQ